MTVLNQVSRPPLFSQLAFLYEKPDDPIPSVWHLHLYHKWRRDYPGIPDPITVPLSVCVGSLEDIESPEEEEQEEKIKEVCA